MTERVAIILAAGKGTRMKSDLPKVLHPVLGRPMLGYVFDACRAAGVQRIYAVVGHGAEQVKAAFADDADVEWILQAEQHGTGHAVLCCADALADFQGQTLVLCGDGPLIKGQTLETLLKTHAESESVSALATTILEDPTGYGRIDRDAEGNILGIVEHNDCSPEQLEIQEVNPSYYCFDNQHLFSVLQRVKPNNAKHEIYLTDAVRIAIEDGQKVVAVTAVAPEEAQSINSVEQLAQVEEMMSERLASDGLSTAK
ncbi:MAG: NTP transferase domain-containing protein [Bacteroidales bacterium]|nr:NTP transferase domain-containing protein [Bacteroidales bacterium]